MSWAPLCSLFYRKLSKGGLSTCPGPQTWEAAEPGSTPEYSGYRATCITTVLPPHLQDEQKQYRRGKVRGEESVAFPGSPDKAEPLGRGQEVQMSINKEKLQLSFVTCLHCFLPRRRQEHLLSIRGHSEIESPWYAQRRAEVAAEQRREGAA